MILQGTSSLFILCSEENLPDLLGSTWLEDLTFESPGNVAIQKDLKQWNKALQFKKIWNNKTKCCNSNSYTTIKHCDSQFCCKFVYLCDFFILPVTNFLYFIYEYIHYHFCTIYTITFVQYTLSLSKASVHGSDTLHLPGLRQLVDLHQDEAELFIFCS